MIDSLSSERMIVKTGGTAGPYLIVSLDQMETVRDLLSNGHIIFSIDRKAIVLGGRETDVVFNLGSSADIQYIQSILDSAN